MAKYIITWDSPYGPEAQIVEAESQQAAEKNAYETWLENAERNYCAEEYTKERAIELELEDEEFKEDADE